MFRSAKHIYAQIIDDERGITLCEASTRGLEVRDRIAYGGNVGAAKIIGETLAKRALAKEITTVRFDRSGYRRRSLTLRKSSPSMRSWSRSIGAPRS